MESKAEEFRTLKQGSMRMQEYANRFITMMRYAPEDVFSEKRKMMYFHRGLNPRVKTSRSGNPSTTLREMINKCLEVERDRQEMDAVRDKKRRVDGSTRTPGPSKVRGKSSFGSRPRFQPRAQPEVRATPAPSRGGGVSNTNYHRPARGAST